MIKAAATLARIVDLQSRTIAALLAGREDLARQGAEAIALLERAAIRPHDRGPSTPCWRGCVPTPGLPRCRRRGVQKRPAYSATLARRQPLNPARAVPTHLGGRGGWWPPVSRYQPVLRSDARSPLNAAHDEESRMSAP